VNYFFDSSALIKLYHPELGSERVAAMFGAEDRRIVISRLGGVELHSALALKTRTGHPDSRRSALLRIRFLNDVASGAIALVAVGESHYPAAERLIIRSGDRKGLRTLDAHHLAVALDVQHHVGLDAPMSDLAGFVCRLQPRRLWLPRRRFHHSIRQRRLSRRRPAVWPAARWCRPGSRSRSCRRRECAGRSCRGAGQCPGS
jgi:predicted nucleic acid-binding protein